MLTIHIGVGKTATTTLQEAYFPNHPGIAYLGKAHCLQGEDQEFRAAALQMILRDSLDYDPAPGRELARKAVSEARESGRVALYSDELIIDTDRDKGMMIERLRQTFGPCRILLTIREQRSFLRSLYGHDNNKLKNLPAPCNGRFLPLEDWLEYQRKEHKRQKGWFWLAEYHRLARALAEAFGRQNLCILPFERFLADADAFFGDLCRFLGVNPLADLTARTAGSKINEGLADRWLQKHLYMDGLKRKGSWLAAHPRLLRLAGALYSNKHKSPAKVRIDLPEKWDADLKEKFRESNRILAQEFDLPLEELGYPS